MSLAERYTILEKLGEGGMAEVYRAQHLLLEREVAIKFVHPYMTDPEFDQRFKREAQAIAHLDHPNIVHLYDFDKDPTRGYFMVMELLQGNDLAHYLRDLHQAEVLMPLGEVVGMTRAVADALGYAHERGVIHRDVKPSNIFLTTHKRVVVTDFGIAKMSNKSAITSTDSIVGTPHYFAPEVASGGLTDHRVDIYATGAVFYQALTGQVPYDGTTPLAVISQHINAPVPDVSKTRPELPALVSEIVQKALAKNPDDRYPNFAAMIDDLDALITELDEEIAFKNRHTPTPRPATRPITQSLDSTQAAFEGNTVVVTGSTNKPTKVGWKSPQMLILLVILALFGAGGLSLALGSNANTTSSADKPTALPPLNIEPATAEEYLYVVANVSNDKHPDLDVSNKLLNALDSGNLGSLLGARFRAEYANRTITSTEEAAQLAEETGALMIVWGEEDAAGLEIVMFVPRYPQKTLREMRFRVETKDTAQYVDIVSTDLQQFIPYVAELMTNQQMLLDNAFLSSLDIARITQPSWGDLSALRIEPARRTEDYVLTLMSDFADQDYAAIDKGMTEILKSNPDESSLYFMRFALNGFILNNIDLARGDIVELQRLLPDSTIATWANVMLYVFNDDYEGLYAATLDIADPQSLNGQIGLFYHAVACNILGKFSETGATLTHLDEVGVNELFNFPVQQNLQALVYELQGDTINLAPVQADLRSDRRIVEVASNLAKAPMQNPPIGLVFWFSYALEVNGATDIAKGAYFLLSQQSPQNVKFLPYWRMAIMAEKEENFIQAQGLYRNSFENAPAPFPIAQYQLALLLHTHPELDAEAGEVCRLLDDATTAAAPEPEFYTLLLAKISALQVEAGCVG